VDVVAAVSGEVVVAVISAVIAVLALAISTEVHLRQTAIQERVAAIEEARRTEEVEARGRAWVTASVARSGRTEPIIGTGTAAIVSWQVWLVLRNDGPALARGVELTDEGPQAPRVMGLEILPVDLQPAQQMVFLIPVGYGTIRLCTSGSAGPMRPASTRSRTRSKPTSRTLSGRRLMDMV
jgi:hypothetical protein